MPDVADAKANRTVNGTEAFVDVKIGAVGLKQMTTNYTNFGTDPDYSDVSDLYPAAVEVEGTVATNVFTRTAGTWVLDDLIGKYALMYIKADFDAATGKTLSGYKLDIQKITDNDTTTITVGQNITAGVTAVVVLDSDYHIVEARTSQDTSKSISLINVNSSDNNGTVANKPGNADKTINCTLLFSPYSAMQRQLEYASEYGCIQKIKTGDIRELGALISEGDYIISDFSGTADTTGEGVISKTCNFSPSANFDFREQVADDLLTIGKQDVVGGC